MKFSRLIIQNIFLLNFHTEIFHTFQKQLLYGLQVFGYILIILHFERNNEVLQEPNKLYEFIQQESLVQIAAESIIGKENQLVLRQLIKANLAHLLALDVHHTNTRFFWMKDALK